MPTFGRRLVDVAQKARGRQALKYEFEVVPHHAVEIPTGIKKVLFAWERGTKLFVTDTESVNPSTRAVFWKQYLRQTATIYKDNGKFVHKEFSFKLQSVSKGANGEDERKTIGKLTVDLAKFCTGQTDAVAQEVFLQLKPHGKLKVSIKATWLKDAQVDPDAMTEMSGPSMYSDRKSHHSHYDEEQDEQDLSGFDHEASTSYDGQGNQEEGGQNHHKHKKKKKKKKRVSLPDEIPEGFEVPPDPEQLRRIKEEHGIDDGELAQEEYSRLVAEITNQVRAEMGTRIHKKGWRDYICCCCGPGHLPLDPQEEDNLLTKKQEAEMKAYNGAD